MEYLIGLFILCFNVFSPPPFIVVAVAGLYAVSVFDIYALPVFVIDNRVDIGIVFRSFYRVLYAAHPF